MTWCNLFDFVIFSQQYRLIVKSLLKYHILFRKKMNRRSWWNQMNSKVSGTDNWQQCLVSKSCPVRLAVIDADKILCRDGNLHEKCVLNIGTKCCTWVELGHTLHRVQFAFNSKTVFFFFFPLSPLWGDLPPFSPTQLFTSDLSRSL